MRKTVFKKILGIIDYVELKGVSFHDLGLEVYELLANENYGVKLQEINHFMDFLSHQKLIKLYDSGIDLSPAATVYAKSNQNSGIEALSIFESFILDDSIHTFYNKQAKENTFVSKDEVLAYMDIECLTFMLQTTLFEVNQDKLRFQPKLMKGIHDVLCEYQNETPLISCFLIALFTSSIVSHEDLRIDYKNSKAQMIAYPYINTILSIIPRRGIPHDRDETKALQSFYKDTLFHEFNHACPLCKIDIPHMLIASHIKPFRDCAHIFEAVDHNNGLLLCRNHDYLFDQGYFTFDEKGYIILSEQLLAIDDVEIRFALKKNYQLPKVILTKNRLLFLQYHREHIFMGIHKA